MLICPFCQGELVYSVGEKSACWTCNKCGRRLMNITSFRGLFGEEAAQGLREHAGNAKPGGRFCPMCGNYMAETGLEHAGVLYKLDVCTGCGSIIVPRELAGDIQPAGPAAPSSPAQAGYRPFQGPAPASPGGGQNASATPIGTALTQHQQERVASFYAQTAARDMAAKYKEKPNAPDAWWKWFLGFIGMPVRYDDVNLKRIPWVTWSMAAIIVLVSLYTLSDTDMNRTVQNLGFIPDMPFRLFGLTFLTSFLLHGSLSHLLGNVYFLLIFGDMVEERLGGLFFFLLVMVSSIVGETLHAALDPGSAALIGASCGIAGLLCFNCLSFPRARLGFFLLFFWVRIPALAFAVVWLAEQFIGARSQLNGVGDVAYLGHLGGVAVGLIFWLIWTYGDEKRQSAKSGQAA